MNHKIHPLHYRIQ